MLTFNYNGFCILKYGVGCSYLNNNGVDSFSGERVRDTAFQGDQRLQQQKLHVIHGIRHTLSSFEILIICRFQHSNSFHQLLLEEQFHGLKYVRVPMTGGDVPHLSLLNRYIYLVVNHTFS